MRKRSLQASSEGIRKARQAFKRKGWTQEYLAGEVGLETRQPIWKFFTGKPVERQVFNEICFVLDISPDEVALTPENNQEPNLALENIIFSASSVTKIDELKQKVQLQLQNKIQHQCSVLRFLDVNRPLNLEDVYVDINVSEEISSQKWLKIENLVNLTLNDLNQFHKSLCYQSGLDVVAKYPRLMVQGRPGSGKSTFLQAIAMKYRQNKFADYIPILINLKSFAENYQNSVYKNQQPNNLFEYIGEYLNNAIIKSELTDILESDKTLILLDGLDEVPESIRTNIIIEINLFVEKFYSTRVVITCRTATQSYKFKDFTEVEIVEFSKLQIITFAYQWFVAVAQASFAQARVLAEVFIQKLELPENQQIREFATTPLLLGIACFVFYSLGDFPRSRSEFYKQCLELLLVRWDETKGIERDEIYNNFSLLDKIKLLSRIAKIYFTEGKYFFTETKTQQLIANYLHQSQKFSQPIYIEDTEGLLLDSVVILKAIEAQHGLLVERARGIYSFSHLMFQEYLTARDIVANVNLHSLEELVTHIHKQHFREVFLLVAEMLPSVDHLLNLMMQEIEKLVTASPKLQSFLIWIVQKAENISTHYNQAAIRAFYFTLGLPPQHLLARNQDIASCLDSQFVQSLPMKINLDLALNHALAVSLAITPDVFYQRLKALHLALDLKHLIVNNERLNNSLHELRSQLPNSNQDREVLKLWWQLDSTAWIQKLQEVMINYCQIGYDWEFTCDEWKLLEKYWKATQLLLDCLNSTDSIPSNEIRQSVEASLFFTKT
ncbi:MAG: NACHT domain-containing NTPase [Calothrix sp. C42_A2020_038]|nr:NACHT domain-containing NTPase [Calothrix sp. C42_A2020_038]